MMHPTCNIVQRKTTRTSCNHKSFYTHNDLYKFDNKNVIYIAYVGNINSEPIYKYGKSAKLFEREYNAHRKNFDTFQMQCVKITDNKDIVEDLFEKELLIRDIHRQIVINSKRQTELFTTTDNYNFSYIIKMLGRLIKDNPSYEVAMLQKKIQQLERKIKTDI